MKNILSPSMGNYLRNGDLEKADELTAKIIWEKAGTATELEFGSEHSRRFTCKYFRALDKFWIEHSNGRFGFSVQSRIWRSPEVNRNFAKFIQRVGWGYWERSPDGNTITIFIYDRADYSPEAPEGHFPWLLGFKEGNPGDREAYLNTLLECSL